MGNNSMRFLSAVLLFMACCGLAAAQDVFAVEALNRAFEKNTPAVCLVSFTHEVADPRSGDTRRRDGNSLGLIVRPDGLVLTHGHMVTENAKPVDVRVRVGRGDSEKEYPAVVLRKPDDVNVVFLQLQSDAPLRLPSVAFAQNPAIRLGEPVALIGLMGETLDYEPGLLMDRVTAVLEQPRTTYCLEGGLRFGFVSSPVINTRGEVVGVTGLDLSRAEGGDLYTRSGHPLLYQAGLLIPHITTPPTQETEKAPHQDAWLGVFTQPLKNDYAEYWGLEKRGGLIVSTVVPDSPAAKAGILPGDVIRMFDGKPQQATQDRDVLGFTQLVRDTGPGKLVNMELLRGGQPLSVQVTLGELPRSAQDAQEYEESVFGLTVREITRDVRIALNIAEDVQGVIVRLVKPGSPAQLGKMRPGVIVLSVGDQPVTNLEEFRQAVEKVREAKPEEVSIFARVGPATGFFRIKPRW